MATGHQVHVCSSRDELAKAAAHLFVKSARGAVRVRGRFSVALAGGSTPRDLYRVLADDDALREAVSWHDAHVFWGDERHVPPTHDESNFRMAREVLLDHVPIPSHQIHRVEAEDPDATRVAVAYEQALRIAFGLEDGGWPSFDLVLLGMGEDGHTASIFPGSTVLHERTRTVVAPFVERFGSHRITLTPPVFAHAREIAVLVAGLEKAHTLHDVLEGPLVPDRYPIQCLLDSIGAVTWLVDAAAASTMTPSSLP
jgi:6-phosphogluconolactonase